LYLWIGMTCFSSKWILSHSTWYKFRRSGQFFLAAAAQNIKRLVRFLSQSIAPQPVTT